MNKGIKEVRQSIMKRKKMRAQQTKTTSTKQIMPMFPQEEEKHGYYPGIPDDLGESKLPSGFATSLLFKGMISVILFFSVALLLKVDVALFEKPQKWTSNIMTEEFPFARINEWYQTTFGTPLSFTPGGTEEAATEAIAALPVSGNVTQTFQVNGSGIMITPQEASPVSAWEDGVVIFAGNDSETNKTVIIQHTDGSKSTYGLLSSIDVHLYQFVGTNQKIGAFNLTEANETVYFSIEKDNKYIDPVQVIKVDDFN